MFFPFLPPNDFLLNNKSFFVEMHIKVLLECFYRLLKLLLRCLSCTLVRMMHLFRVELFVAYNAEFVSDVTHDTLRSHLRFLRRK